MNTGIIVIAFLVFVSYYSCVIAETFGTKYYKSAIKTKKDFFLCLIPLFMWVKLFINAFKELE